MTLDKRPQGDKAQEFVRRWTDSFRHPEQKLQILSDFNCGLRTASRWYGQLKASPLALTRKVQVVINDLHVPYHDPQAVKVMLSVINDVKPHEIDIAGDLLDFYQMSKFDKNPLLIPKLQENLNTGRELLKGLRETCPGADIYYELGNHEDRLRRYLWSIAKELSSLECLEIDNLLGLKSLKIKMIEYEEGRIVNGVFSVSHGSIASIHSGFTAKRTFEKQGGNGIVGHSHRGGSFYKTDKFGTHGYWENFCLCNLEPDYVKHPNWQQGFSIINYIGDRFFVEQIPIVKGKCVYGGKLYE